VSFVAMTKGKSPRTFIVGAEAIVTWHAACGFAAQMLGVDPTELDCIETGDTRPDCVLRWVGSDAGDTPTRRMEVKFRDGRHGEAFGEWVSVREAVAPAWVLEERPPARAPQAKKGRKV
jgi:hypothetical protein